MFGRVLNTSLNTCIFIFGIKIHLPYGPYIKWLAHKSFLADQKLLKNLFLVLFLLIIGFFKASEFPKNLFTTESLIKAPLEVQEKAFKSRFDEVTVFQENISSEKELIKSVSRIYYFGKNCDNMLN